MAGYLASNAAAGPYLADQLLLPMALAGGGSFTTVKPSRHARTAADIIARFLDVAIAFDEQEDGCHLVTVEPVEGRFGSRLRFAAGHASLPGPQGRQQMATNPDRGLAHRAGQEHPHPARGRMAASSRPSRRRFAASTCPMSCILAAIAPIASLIGTVVAVRLGRGRLFRRDDRERRPSLSRFAGQSCTCLRWSSTPSLRHSAGPRIWSAPSRSRLIRRPRLDRRALLIMPTLGMIVWLDRTLRPLT